MTTHSSILAWKMPQTEEPDHVPKRRTQLKRLSMHGCKDVSHHIQPFRNLRPGVRSHTKQPRRVKEAKIFIFTCGDLISPSPWTTRPIQLAGSVDREASLQAWKLRRVGNVKQNLRRKKERWGKRGVIRGSKGGREHQVVWHSGPVTGTERERRQAAK